MQALFLTQNTISNSRVYQYAKSCSYRPFFYEITSNWGKNCITNCIFIENKANRRLYTGYFLLQFLPKIIIFETCSKPEGFVLILKILPLWLFRQIKQQTAKLLRFTSVKNWDSNQIWQSFVYPAETAKVVKSNTPSGARQWQKS